MLGGLLGAVLLLVVYWIKGLLSDRVSLKTSEATLQAERERIVATERADAAERQRRAQEFDAKAASVSSASDAADLLRGQLARAGHPSPDKL